ncbi:MAG: phage tail tape measure protein, partial [Candidatus Cloacimonetes bacterium]|nr:phage tail tape measure protein [Candidatus Cloacimonadota bacterium]
MPAFEISGTANLSNITSELQKLNTTLSNIKVPAIKVPEPNFGNFFSAIDKIEAKTLKIKSVIEPPNTVSGGFSSFLNSEKGKFANVGKEMGQSLQMGMQQQFGMMGGMATSLASALGPIGIAAGVGAVGLGVLAAASTKAAMAWEDMKTSIGRTTGLKGDNLEDLMNQLQDLRQEFGVTAQAASDMVEQAGSIGVGQSKLNAGNLAGYKQEILDFTKATAILQGAWGMSAEATAQGIGKMGSVTLGQWNMQRKARGEEELSWADYAYRVGGQVDNLANAMGSSEEEIVTAMRNSSGAIAKYAPSEETYGKWQAMASFLIDTGASAGEAGTQIERVAQKMDQNGADVANILGIDQASLSANLKTDFMGTVQSLGEAIAAMPESERPDTAKMFGLEGKSLIDKVVADIEQGTGKLQNAIDLAMSPGNVAEGYEDVADNASKAFDRIGQAFQVSLEKIGGQLLPIVTDFANLIADAWVAGNEIGSNMFAANAAGQDRIKATAAAGGGLFDQTAAYLGLLSTSDMDKNQKIYEDKMAALAKAKEEAAAAAAAVNQSEYEKTAQYSIGERALSGASFSDASFKDLGTKSGIGYVDALSNELDTALPKAFTDSYLKLYDVAGKAAKELGKQTGEMTAEEFTKANDDYAKAHSSGGYSKSALEGGTIVTSKGEKITVGAMGSQYATRREDEFLEDYTRSTALPGLDEYIQKTWLEQHGTRKDTMTAFFDTSGKQISGTFDGFFKETRDAAYDAFTDGIQPGIKDSARYFKAHSSEFADTVSSIWEDGAISGTEKLTAENMLKSLDLLSVKYPVEFELAGLDERRAELKAALDGIDVRINLDKETLAIGVAEFINENFALHTKMLAAGQPPMAANETSYFKLMQGYQDRGDDETVKQLTEIDDIIAAGNYQEGNTAAVLEEKLNYVVKAHPELTQQTAFQQRIATANKDLVSMYGISTGNLLQIKTSTDATKTSSENIQTNTERTATGIYEVRDILAAGGFGNTVYNTYNSPSIQSNADSGRWSSASAWASDYGMGSTWGTATKGAVFNKNILKDALAKAGAVYQEGGLNGPNEGAAWLHPGEMVFSPEQMQCAVSSQYQMLENPALFKQTGGIYPTAQGPNYQQLAATVNTLNTELLTTIDRSTTMSGAFTYVSDMWFDKDYYDRLTISAPISGFQSSAKRGQVPVSISDAAKAGMGFRNPFTDETADEHFGMSARIFAAQMEAQGKSQVMPSGAHEEPQWAVDASGGIITKQSQGVLNRMAIE